MRFFTLVFELREGKVNVLLSSRRHGPSAAGTLNSFGISLGHPVVTASVFAIKAFGRPETSVSVYS